MKGVRKKKNGEEWTRSAKLCAPIFGPRLSLKFMRYSLGEAGELD